MLWVKCLTLSESVIGPSSDQTYCLNAETALCNQTHPVLRERCTRCSCRNRVQSAMTAQSTWSQWPAAHRGLCAAFLCARKCPVAAVRLGPWVKLIKLHRCWRGSGTRRCKDGWKNECQTNDEMTDRRMYHSFPLCFCFLLLFFTLMVFF